MQSGSKETNSEINVNLVDKTTRKPGAPNYLRILLPFAGVVLTAMAVMYADLRGTSVSKDGLDQQLEAEREKTQRVLDADLAQLNLKIDQQEKDRELSTVRFVSEVLDGLDEQRSYENDKQAIMLIAKLAGVERAVQVEPAYRSGGTVRALQMLRQEQSHQGNNTTVDPLSRIPLLLTFRTLRQKPSLLEESLNDIPMVFFLDSTDAGNVYCNDSQRRLQTNIDDIVYLVRDLPIQVVAEKTYQTFDMEQRDTLVARIHKNRPSLIVMHNSAFEGSDYEGESGGKTESVKSFLEDVITEDHTPDIIVYSRTQGFDSDMRAWATKNLLHTGIFFEPLKLQGKDDSVADKDCFSADRQNGIEIVAAIKSALETSELYKIEFPKQ